MVASSTTTRTPSSSCCRRRSVAIGSQTEVGGQRDREGQGFARVALRDRHVVDDDERRRALQLVNELPEALVFALPLRADLEDAEARVLGGRLFLEPAGDG